MVEQEGKDHLRFRKILVYGLPFEAVKTLKDRFDNGDSVTEKNVSVFNTDGFGYLPSQDLSAKVRETIPDILILGCYPREGIDTFTAYEPVLADLLQNHRLPVLFVGAQSDTEERLKADFSRLVKGRMFFPDEKGREPPSEKTYSYLLSMVESALSDNINLRYRLGIIGAGNAAQSFVLDGLLKEEDPRFNSVNVYTRTRNKAESLRSRVMSIRGMSKNPNLEVVVHDSMEDVLRSSGIVLVTAADVKREGTGDRTSMLYAYVKNIIVPLGNAINAVGYTGNVSVYTNPPELLASVLYAITKLRGISAITVLDQLRPSSFLKPKLSQRIFELTSKNPSMIDLDFLCVHSLGFLGLVKDTIRADGKPISKFGIPDLESMINKSLRVAADLPHAVRLIHDGISPPSESEYALLEHIKAVRRAKGTRDILAGIKVDPLSYLNLSPSDEESARILFPNGIFMGVPTRFSRTMMPCRRLHRTIDGEEVPIKLRTQGSHALYRNLLYMRKVLMDERITSLSPEVKEFFERAMVKRKRQRHKKISS